MLLSILKPICYPYFSLISLSNNAIHKFSDYRLNTISDRQDVATPLRAYCRPDERANTVRHCLQSVILISEQQTDNQQLYSINILQTREKYRESVKATNYINRSSSEILHTSNENRHLRYLSKGSGAVSKTRKTHRRDAYFLQGYSGDFCNFAAD